MQLVLDFGNSFQKCAIFSDKKMICLEKFQNISLLDLQLFCKNHTNISSCIISSVINTDENILKWLEKKFFFINLNHNTPIPIINKYENTEALGKDRLAAAIGANSIFKSTDILTIDIGTAIKFDFINSKNEYIGGSISPGLSLRFQALHNFTAKLPLVHYNNIHNLIGTDTETSILSGVINGIIAEINEIINQYNKEYLNLKIILTGGDSIYFEKYLKNDIFALSNLVQIGLNEILKFNETNNSL